MTSILSVELYRLKKSKLFWALFGVTAGMPLVYVALLAATTAFLGLFEQNAGIDAWQMMRSLNLTCAMLSEYADVMHFSSLMAVIFTSVFLSREFAYGTFRSMLIAGKTRAELYLSHLVVALCVGTTFLALSMTSTLIFGGAVFGFYEMSAGKVVLAIVTAFAMGEASVLFAQSMMCMFLFGTRKLAAALACTLVICLVAPGMFSFVVEVLATFNLIVNGVMDLDMSMSWVPLYNTALLDVSHIDGALVGKILLYLVPFTALFLSLGWVTFRKADLK